MPLAFYMDEQVEDAITRGLRQRGIDVLRVQDDGHRNTDDGIILDRAAVLGRVVFTRDDDFLAIACDRQTRGIPFAGVVYAHPENVTIGRCVTDLELIAFVSLPGEMWNTVKYLPIR